MPVGAGCGGSGVLGVLSGCRWMSVGAGCGGQMPVGTGYGVCMGTGGCWVWGCRKVLGLGDECRWVLGFGGGC